jgi:hypothetical protein
MLTLRADGFSKDAPLLLLSTKKDGAEFDKSYGGDYGRAWGIKYKINAPTIN